VTDLQEIFLLGPTAAGKDCIASLLAEALDRSGSRVELLAMDSMKVYRGLDLISDAPTPLDREVARWHMTGVVECQASYSVARYVEESRAVATEIRARGAMPIWVGGTTLYYRALVDGLVPSPPADPELRDRLTAQHESDPEGLHRRLAEVDPRTAARVHPNDCRRIVRALEHLHLTGRPLGEEAISWSSGDAGPAGARRVLGIMPPWAELRERIESRAAIILAGGVDGPAVAEVAAIQRAGGFSRQAAAALGVAEALALLAGDLDLASACAELTRRTRRLAKAQRTWFRSLQGVEWVLLDPAMSAEAAADRLLQRIRSPAQPAPATF